MNAPVRLDWWSGLLADPWLCGRQSPAERDAALAADPVQRAARAAGRRDLAERTTTAAARIRGTAKLMALVHGTEQWRDAGPFYQP